MTIFFIIINRWPYSVHVKKSIYFKYLNLIDVVGNLKKKKQEKHFAKGLFDKE